MMVYPALENERNNIISKHITWCQASGLYYSTLLTESPQVSLKLTTLARPVLTRYTVGSESIQILLAINLHTIIHYTKTKTCC